MLTSYRPDSLLTMVAWSASAASTQQHPGHAPFPCLVKCADHPLTLRKIERAFLHREEEKRPMNVIFYFLFSVG